MKVKCLIFDFDGTVADTIDHALQILNSVSEEYGFRTLDPSEVAKARDMNASQLIRHLRVPRLKIPKILARGKELLAERVHHIKAIHDMPRVVRDLRGQYETLGILTSNSKSNVKAFLHDKKIEVFDFVSTVSKLTGKSKNLKAIMKTFDYHPHELLFIGDEIRDLKAGQKAGVRTAGVTWGFNSRRALAACKPDYLFDHPHEILSRIKRPD